MDTVPLGLSLTPHGRLALTPDADAPPLNRGLADRLRQAFERGPGHGLLLLGADEPGTALPPVYSYWREFGAHYVTALCTRQDTDASIPAPSDEELERLALVPALLIGLRRGDEEKELSKSLGMPGAPSLRRFCSCRKGGKPQIFEAPRFLRMAVVCALLALMPFAAWSWRNWQVFHVFEPLAPRLATDPGEATHPGWERWVKSWCLDFVSTYYIYWNVPGDVLDVSKLPSRAFDSPAQYAETAALAADYNLNLELTPALDARFGKLAGERVAAHPLRSALWLPLGRMADMWLRPRVENLPIELDWWNYNEHQEETCISWAYAGLNALYLLLGVAGLCLRPRFWRAMLAYILLRSALLTTIAAPEARYTLECFPMLFALGGVALYRFTTWVLLVVLKVKASAGRG